MWQCLRTITDYKKDPQQWVPILCRKLGWMPYKLDSKSVVSAVSTQTLPEAENPLIFSGGLCDHVSAQETGHGIWSSEMRQSSTGRAKLYGPHHPCMDYLCGFGQANACTATNYKPRDWGYRLSEPLTMNDKLLNDNKPKDTHVCIIVYLPEHFLWIYSVIPYVLLPGYCV